MNIMKDYEISMNTMALVEEYHLEYNTIIYDVNGIYYTKQTVKSLLEEACIKRFSTYEGRLKPVRKLLDYVQKTPLLICPTQRICAFPITSPQKYGCTWILPYHVQSYEMKNGKLIVTFNNGIQLPLNCSLRVFKNQQERTANCLNYYQRMTATLF